MKRSQLIRRTPMPSPSKPMRKGGPVRKVSAKRQQQTAPRRAAEAALAAIRPGCWMCGRLDVEVHGHEILGRAQGGDPTKPDALLCNPCNELCESEPILAAWYGWKRTRKPHPVQPCTASGECLPWAHRLPSCERWDYRASGAA